MTRVIRLTAGSPGVSSATLFVIVAVIVVIGYIILEKGSSPSSQSSRYEEAEPAGDPERKRKKARPEPIVTSSDPQPPMQAKTGKTSPSETAPSTTATAMTAPLTGESASTALSGASASGPGRSALKGKRAESGGVLNGARGVQFRGVSENGDETSSAAVGIRRFEAEDPAVRFVDNNEAIMEHKNIHRTGDDRPKHFSPLSTGLRLELKVKEGSRAGTAGSALMQMKAIEDQLRLVQLSDVWGDEYASAIPDLAYTVDQGDVWHHFWGKVPQAILGVCTSILAQGKAVLDIEKLALAMTQEDEIAHCAGCKAAAIAERGFDVQLGVDEETGSKITSVVLKQDPAGQEAAVDLLLGFFMLPYRAYRRTGWMTFSKRGRKGGLYPEVEQAVGSTGAAILLWLDWVADHYLAYRLFRAPGADILDASARVFLMEYSPKAQNSQAAASGSVFIMDLTLFVPENSLLQECGKIADPLPHWTQRPVKDGAYQLWLNESVVACLRLADNHIQRWHRLDGAALDRIVLRRLFFRPGFSVPNVDLAEGQTRRNKGPIEEFIDTQDATLIKLDQARYLTWRRELGGDYKHSSIFLNLAQQCHFSHIQFLNKRQNNWYIPASASNGVTPQDDFDARQIEFVLGLIQPAYDFNASNRADLRDVKNNTRRHADTRAPAALAIDWGGMFPFISSNKGLQWMSVLTAATHHYIPYIEGGKYRIKGLQAGDDPGMLKPYRTIARWLMQKDSTMYSALKDVGQILNVVLPVSSDRAMDDARKTICTALEAQSLVIARSLAAAGVSREGVYAQIGAVYSLIAPNVFLTNCGQCQTGVIERLSWPLGFDPELELINQVIADAIVDESSPGYQTPGDASQDSEERRHAQSSDSESDENDETGRATEWRPPTPPLGRRRPTIASEDGDTEGDLPDRRSSPGHTEDESALHRALSEEENDIVCQSNFQMMQSRKEHMDKYLCEAAESGDQSVEATNRRQRFSKAVKEIEALSEAEATWSWRRRWEKANTWILWELEQLRLGKPLSAFEHPTEGVFAWNKKKQEEHVARQKAMSDRYEKLSQQQWEEAWSQANMGVKFAMARWKAEYMDSL